MYRFRSDLREFPLPVVDVPLTETLMCLNESTLDPSSVVFESFLRHLRSIKLNRYFSPVTAELEHKLSNYAGLPREQIVWGNGADQMLQAVFMAVRESAGSFIVSLAPSYFDYRTYSRAVGLQVRKVDIDPETWDFDLPAYLQLLSEPNCKLAVLCHPNNPTGHLLDEDKIHAILRATDKPVIVDETYFEFSGRTFRNELPQYPNLILVRSFSKAFSGAGLRFGYMLTSAENAHELKKSLTFFNTSLLVQAYALAVLEHADIFAAHNREVLHLRDRLFTALSAIPGIRVHPSQTNFLSFTAGETTPQLYQTLIEHGIALRNVGSHPALRNHLRVTVGSETDNLKFLTIVREFLQGDRVL